MKTFIMFILQCFIIGLVHAQVGINTTNPNAVLEIKASNVASPSNTDGLLIPKVDNFSTSNPSASQDGMIIFATGSGTPSKGFYYWDNATTSWVGFSTGANSEWVDNGTYLSPLDGNAEDVAIGGNYNANARLTVRSDKSISGLFTNTTVQNIAMYGVNTYLLNTSTSSSSFTIGNYNDIINNGLGTTYGDYNYVRGTGSGSMFGNFNRMSSDSNGLLTGNRTDILGNGSGAHYGGANFLSGSGGGTQTGLYNYITNSGNGFHNGIHNALNGSGINTHWGVLNDLYGSGTGGQTGVRNNITNTADGIHIGVESIISNNGNGLHTGTKNEITGTGSGQHYGTNNYLGGTGSGNKYGSFNYIPDSAGGTHYGVYSNVTKAGSYAGYFLGRLAVSTSSGDYIFPISRGTNGQIVKTDGSGNLYWDDEIGEDHDFYQVGSTSAATNINDNIFTYGNVGLNNNSPNYTLDIDDDRGTTSINIQIDDFSAPTTVADSYGVKTNIGNINSGLSTGASYGMDNTISVLNEGYGVQNTVTGPLGSSGNLYGTYNMITNSGSGDSYGSYNLINNTVGSGLKYASYNRINGVGIGIYSQATDIGGIAGYFLGTVSIGTTMSNTYNLPASRGTNRQIMQTDGSGNVSWISPSAIGNWSLTGNSGTNPVSQFFGTTDNVDIAVRTNNVEKFRFTTLGQLEFLNNANNVFIGENTGESQAGSSGGHTFVGTNAGRFSNAISFWNTFVGNDAGLNNTSGSVNTYIGVNAGKETTTGSGNTYIGKDAGSGSTVGNTNVAIGQKCAEILTTGNDNVFIGQLLGAGGDSSKNVVIGKGANAGNGIGNSNNNVFLGYLAGSGQANGSNNILIGGNELDLPNQSGSNQLNIGNIIYGTNLDGTANTVSTGSIGLGIQNPQERLDVNGSIKLTTLTTNAALLQNDDNFNHLTDNNLDFGDEIDSWTLSSREGTTETSGIHGDRDFVTIWSPGDNGRMLRFVDEDAWGDNNGNPFDNAAEIAYVDNNGQFVQASDRNRKENIERITQALQKLKQINGYSYQFKDKSSKNVINSKTSGVIAQELEKVLPEAVQINENGDYFVHYAGIIPLLIEGLKEQQKEIEKLNREVNYLKQLEDRIINLEKKNEH